MPGSPRAPLGSAGELDLSFGIQGRRIKTVPNSQPGGDPDFFSSEVIIQPDGKILISGYAFDSAFGTSMVVARYTPDGALDATFASGGIFRFEFPGGYVSDELYGMALQADGKIVAVGETDVGNGDPAWAIIRLNPNGTFDPAFGTNGIVVKNFFSSIDQATDVAIQPDGKLLVSGWVTQNGINNGLTYDFTIVRYNPDGSEDPSYGNSGVVFTDFNGRGDLAQASELLPDGKLIVSGWVAITPSPDGAYDVGLARYNTDGSLDTTFGSGGKVVTTFRPGLNELLREMALAPGGKIVITGDLYNPGIGGGGGHRDLIAARYNEDGSLDPGFDGDGRFIYDSNLGDRNEAGEDIIAQPDGKLVITGRSHLRSTQFGADIDMLLLRLNEGGGLDTTFGSGGITYTDFGIFAGQFTTPRSGDTGTAITLQQDGKIVVAGDSAFGGDTTERPSGEGPTGHFSSRLHVARFQNDIGPSPGVTPTPTPAVTATPTATPGATATPTPAVTATPAATPSATATPTPAVTATPSATPVATATPTPAVTATPVATPGTTATPTVTPVTTATPTPIATATPTATSAPTSTPAPTPTPIPPTQAINLSTRVRVQSGDNVGIGGFIITGSAPKRVLIRAIGPSLAGFGVPDVLANPTLELNGPGEFVKMVNDNWRDTQELAIQATGIAPTNDFESAIDATLSPGAYTAVVRGSGDTSGVALIEVFDLSLAVPAKLANISTRAFVSTGTDIVIAGFILGNDSGNDRVVVRGIGPSLTGFGVPDALANPTLELRDNNGALLFANNDWQTDPAQAAELTAAGLAPSNPLESGIAAMLPPGAYTALLAGANNGIGIGVVEVYDRGATP